VFTGDDVPLKNLPKTSKGILGLARTKLSLPKQISSSSSHKLPNKFALCLPSSNKKGFGSLFIGGIPQQSSFFKFQLTKIPLLTPLALLQYLLKVMLLMNISLM
jgi:hypothetical protein